MVVLYSAVSAESGLLVRQAMRFAVGLGAFFVMAQIPPHYLRLFTPWMYFLGIGLLLFVAVEGQIGKGAQRWLDLGVVTFQPSELLKLAVPMMCAWFMHERRLPPTFPQLMVMALIVLTPALLIVEQPDLGTALLVIAGGGITILLAGISVRLMLVFGGLGLATLPVLWTFMHDYQKARVFTFLNPESDPLGTGYNIIQSKIALGSGGMWGRGFLQGTQGHLDFLPEKQTDFIFTMIGEEFGFMGGVAVMALLCLIVLGGMLIALRCRHQFGRLVAFGIASNFFLYVFVNIAMVMGAIPVGGVRHDRLVFLWVTGQFMACRDMRPSYNFWQNGSCLCTRSRYTPKKY